MIFLALLIIQSQAEIDEWLKGLSHDDPEVRDNSTKSLVQHMCLKQVEKLLGDDDAEVNLRAELIIKTIKLFETHKLTGLLKKNPGLCLGLASTDPSDWLDTISNTISEKPESLTYNEMNELAKIAFDKLLNSRKRRLFQNPEEKYWWFYLVTDATTSPSGKHSPLAGVYKNLDGKTQDIIVESLIAMLSTELQDTATSHLSTIKNFSKKHLSLVVQKSIEKLPVKSFHFALAQILSSLAQQLDKDEQKSVIEDLFKNLESSNMVIKEGSAILLPEIATVQATEIFLRLLDRVEYEIHRKCLRRLSRNLSTTQQKEILESIMKILDKETPPKSAVAAGLLSMSEHISGENLDQASEAMQKCLNDKNPKTRSHIITAFENVAILHGYKPLFILDIMLAEIKSSDAEVQLAASHGLKQLSRFISQEKQDELVGEMLSQLEKDESSRIIASLALYSMSKNLHKALSAKIAKTLHKYATDKNPKVRANSIKALSDIAYQFGFEAQAITKIAVDELQNKDFDIKLAAIESVIRLSRVLDSDDKTKVFDSLLSFLEETDKKIREESAWALKQFAPYTSNEKITETFAKLAKIAKDGSSHAKHGAILGLGNISFRFDNTLIAKLAQLLVSSLDEDSIDIQNDAALVLAQIAHRIHKDHKKDVLKQVEEKLKTIKDDLLRDRLVRSKEILETALGW